MMSLYDIYPDSKFTYNDVNLVMVTRRLVEDIHRFCFSREIVCPETLHHTG